MKPLLAVLAVLAMVGIAGADSRGVHAYDGQIVISPDPVPSTAAELTGYLKANVAADRHYELIKGPPWEINLVGVLAKTPKTVTLVFAVASDAKLAAVQSIEVTPKDGLVIAHVTATIAAGFEANQTYVVRLMSKTIVLARAELKLRG